MGAGVADARDLDAHLGHAEQPRQQRLDDFDALQSGQLQPAFGPGQDAGRDPQVAFPVEPERQPLPGQVLHARSDQRDDQRHDHNARKSGEHRERRLETSQQTDAHEQRQRQHSGGMHERGDRMGAPGCGGTGGRWSSGQCFSGSERPGAVRDGARRWWEVHIPAERASPWAARRSRSRAASTGVSPGIPASVVAAAVCNLTVAKPMARSIGPATRSTSCIRP